VTLAKDGKTLASGDENGSVKLWDADTGKELQTLGEHDHTVWSLAFTKDGDKLASGSADKTIKVWDVKKKKELYTLKKHMAPSKKSATCAIDSAQLTVV
jgi:WD40 repeat protein